MNILQLCCFTDLWHSKHEICSYDLRTGNDILDLPDDFGRNFDLVVSAPPCTQFTKANNLNWIDNPWDYINIAKKCFTMSINSGAMWFLENPPGRIETFLPELTNYRMLTWSGTRTNKEYVIYSNFLILSCGYRYNKPGSTSNMSLRNRDRWQPDLIADIERSLSW
jgi:site-specific DNA-cytosine methylase